MARRRSNLSSRTSRTALPISDQPTWEVIGKGVRLGYRRGNRGGTWLVATRRPDNTRVQEKIGKADDLAAADGKIVFDHDQAKAEARRRVGEILRGRAAMKPLTVDDILDRYFEAKASEMKSHKDSKQRAALHIRPALGKKLAAHLSTEDIRKWRDSLAESAPQRRKSRITIPKAPKHAEQPDQPSPVINIRQRRDSTNRVLTILKAALNWAYREGLVVDDNAWRRAKPFRETTASRVRFLTPNEQTQLINACEGSLRNLVAAALMTGARFGELARLEVRDFHPEAGKLFIAESKSGKSRFIPLAANGRKFFESLTAGKPPTAHLLEAGVGKSWAKDSYQRDFRLALARAKLEKITLHELRHTYASTMVSAGAPLVIVAQALGHSDTRMAEKHYAHLAENFVMDTIRATAPDHAVDMPVVTNLKLRA